MTITEQRQRYREVLDGNECVHPASVFDPISGRIAQDLGFRVGMFAGSIASATVLGTPDLVVLTLSEFADQIRRIMRAADIPLMVDADHGLRQRPERYPHSTGTRARWCLRDDH